jgi:uncharacterized membrane protein ArfB
MDFVIQWLCYLLAFVAGSAAAWMIVTVSITRASHQEQVRADGSGSREVSAG